MKNQNLYSRLKPKYKKYLDQHAEQFPNVYGHLKNELLKEHYLANIRYGLIVDLLAIQDYKDVAVSSPYDMFEEVGHGIAL